MTKINEAYVDEIYRALKAKGLIYEGAREQLFCPKDQRFLPGSLRPRHLPVLFDGGSIRRCLRIVRQHIPADRVEKSALRVVRHHAGITQLAAFCSFKSRRVQRTNRHVVWMARRQDHLLPLQDEVRNFVQTWINDGLRGLVHHA